MKKKITKDSSIKKGIAVAGAVAVLGGLIAYGIKSGKVNPKKIKGWMLKAKGEVLEEIENLKDLSEESYGVVVDKVLKKYKSVMKDHKEDVEFLSKELKKHWKYIKSKVSSKKTKSKK